MWTMNKLRKRALVTLLAASMTATSLSGCGSSFGGTDVAAYPLASETTLQELIDYYSKAYTYDSIVTKNIEVHEAEYELHDVSSKKVEKLRSLVSQAEAILHENNYEDNEANNSIIPRAVYHYLKSTFDNEVLTNGTIKNIQGALGYYFVDVEYDLSAKKLGNFNQYTPLVGISGAFLIKADKEHFDVDTAYMITITRALCKYFMENKIRKGATFDVDTRVFQVLNDVDPVEYYNKSLILGSDPNKGVVGLVDENGNPINYDDQQTSSNPSISDYEIAEDNLGRYTMKDGVRYTVDSDGNVYNEDGSIKYTAEQFAQISADAKAEQQVTDATGNLHSDGLNYNSIVLEDRRIPFDTTLINSIAGISSKLQAFCPNLDFVFEKTEPEGTYGGFGIYAAGGSGLRVFDFDRNKINGKATVRYVYKDTVDGTDNIIGVNAYVVEEEILNGINVSSTNVTVSSVVETQLEMLLERSDRCMANCDLSGLMNGRIYQDMGVTLLRGYKDDFVNVNSYMSTIREIRGRDIDTNSYLVEIETTIQEGPRMTGTFGTYRDKSMLAIQQQGTYFVIVDSVRLSREMVKEPSINPDSAVLKRLVALNLTGPVTDEAKASAKELLDDWYLACRARTLKAKKDDGTYKVVNVGGEDIEIHRGMYDIFQDDVTMLNSEQLEYDQSKMRNILDKYGNLPIEYEGLVTEWIGGYDNQVEFTTEELVTYPGMNSGYYMQVYYLISNMNDKWVVDERKILDERLVENTDFNTVKERFK